MTEPRDQPPMPGPAAPPAPTDAAGDRTGVPESRPGTGAVGWTVHESTWDTGDAGDPQGVYSSDHTGAARPWATIADVVVAGPAGDAADIGDADGAEGEGGAGDADGAEGEDGQPYQRRDWAWVEQWRESGERPAWAPGLALAAFVAVLVGLAVLVLSQGLSDMLWLAIAANVLVAAGLAPALWLSRHLPVLRWISAGAAAGVVVGWIGALIS